MGERVKDELPTSDNTEALKTITLAYRNARKGVRIWQDNITVRVAITITIRVVGRGGEARNDAKICPSGSWLSI